MIHTEAFHWDLDALEQALDGRTKAIVFSNPTNPTGFMPTQKDLSRLAELARRHEIIAIADESYDRLVYGEGLFVPAVSVPDWSERFVIVRSLSKSFALAPWRVGYIVAAERLVDQFMKVAEWEILYTSHVGQAVATAAISGPLDWLAGVSAGYRDNRDLVWQALEASSWLQAPLPPAGQFFFVDASPLAAKGVDVTRAAARRRNSDGRRRLVRRPVASSASVWRQPRRHREAERPDRSVCAARLAGGLDDACADGGRVTRRTAEPALPRRRRYRRHVHRPRRALRRWALGPSQGSLHCARLR